MTKVAIIGAGMAGLACARELRGAGLDVRVFDKGRGPGGRMSTRRMDTPLGEARFDHGAQFFTARLPAFRAVTDAMIARGNVAEWTGNFVTIGADGRATADRPRRRLVGVPGMNAVIRDLADGLDVRYGARITRINRSPDGKLLLDIEEAAPEGPFDIAICAVPAEQVPPLLSAASPALARNAATALAAPSWTLMAAFDHPLPVDWDGAEPDTGPIGWAARDNSKPGRPPIESWVVQASTAASRALLEDPAEAVAERLLSALHDLVGARPRPIAMAAHRWRYAYVERSADSPIGWDVGAKIGTCGDWHCGPRVELAWQSGADLAAHILGHSPAITGIPEQRG